jgi:hypothetical protein
MNILNKGKTVIKSGILSGILSVQLVVDIAITMADRNHNIPSVKRADNKFQLYIIVYVCLSKFA